jgi:Ca2+-binding EF-hand superfamily protein
MADLMTMKEFVERMGASANDAPRDAFTSLDANSNEFIDWSEFRHATEDFQPPLSLKEAENMFDWLDRNHDGRIESLEFLEAYKLSSTSPVPNTAGPGPITLAQYRRSLGHHVQYSKVGVGLCRTDAEAWPQSSEHPTAATKSDCQAICDGSLACGAYAFKIGGTCRIYPAGKEYGDTTPMTDVECFSKAVSNKPLFDLVRVSLHLFGNAGEISKGELAVAEMKLAESVAFEVGEPVSALRSSTGEPGKCTIIQAAHSGAGDASGPEEEDTKELESVCFIDVPKGVRIEDLTAVITTKTTRNKIAQDMSALNGMPHFTADSIHAYVEGTSAKFRTTDTDHSGAVSVEELIKAAGTFEPAINEEAAEFAFSGLDWNRNNQLSPDEFEAHGITDFFKSPS